MPAPGAASMEARREELAERALRDVAGCDCDLMGRVNPIVLVRLAGHHPMRDQPLLLITALDTLLADRDHSEPRTWC